MKIILTQQEIEAAITAHVLSTISVREGTDLKIDFTATRSTDGITATIDIPYMGVSSIDLPMTAPVTAEAPSTEGAGTKATLPVKPKAPAAKPKGGIFGGLPSPAPVADNAADTAAETGDNAEQAAVDNAEAEQASDAADAAATETAATAPAAGKSLFGTD